MSRMFKNTQRNVGARGVAQWVRVVQGCARCLVRSTALHKEKF
jgi:hypothetical protein